MALHGTHNAMNNYRIAWSIATISIALATPCVYSHYNHNMMGNKRYHRAYEYNACTTSFVPTTFNSMHAIRRKRKLDLSMIINAEFTASTPKSISQKNVDDHDTPSSIHFHSLSTKQSPKRRKVQFVPWAGKKGMLPHQYYSGVLNYEEYYHWLRIPLIRNASIPKANCTTEKYFTTKASSISNSTFANQIEPPQVQPRHLKPIYIDEHITVVSKPSGVLSVPGPRRHECVASLVYRYFGKSNNLDSENGQAFCEDAEYMMQQNDNIENDTWQPLTALDNKQIDTTVVHRLDRDTSGVLLFARNDNALKKLHADFKDKTRKKVTKRYVALVCGHWKGQSNDSINDCIAIDEGEIDLPLVRDLERPPFMRVATIETKLQQERLKQQSDDMKEQNNTKDSKLRRHQHSGYLRMVGKGAKASLTTYRVLSYEYIVSSNQELLPVTRVELQPITGRTHQLVSR